MTLAAWRRSGFATGDIAPAVDSALDGPTLPFGSGKTRPCLTPDERRALRGWEQGQRAQRNVAPWIGLAALAAVALIAAIGGLGR